MLKGKIKIIGNIVLNVLLCIFLAISMFAVFVTVRSKLAQKDNKDDATEIFGYQMRIVTSDSMASCEYTDVSAYDIKDIPVRSMVFVKIKPTDSKALDEWYSNLKVGDVLTFRYVYASQVTITHRITSIEEKPTGGYIIKLAGDNKNSDAATKGQLEQVIDTSAPNNDKYFNYIIGKVEGQSYPFGVIMSIIMQPLGIVFIIIVPCIAIILSEVIKIVKVVGSDKKNKEQEAMAAKEKELEELRRRLDELERNKNNKGDET